MNSNLAYRADIDILRAVAVIITVAYHAFPVKLQFGIAGVDIFFVISGYLITSILISEIENKEFSISNFYSRRIRRIFPALVTILFFSIVSGYLILMPEEFVNLSKYVISAVSFSTNLLFISEVNYFSSSATTNPLLHLWSLAVEEQFYILWPVALLFMFRLKNENTRFLIMLVLIASSLLYAMSNTSISIFPRINPETLFYSPLSRAWELLLGSVVLFIQRYRSISRIVSKYSAVNEIGATVGWVVLFVSLAFINGGHGWPNLSTILPVLGAMLIVMFGGFSRISQLLGRVEVVRQVGLISYPLYLWHWVLFAFSRAYYSAEPSKYEMLFLAFSSLLLAWLTCKYIERPFRSGKLYAKSTKYLTIGMLLISLLGVLIIVLKGIPSRVPTEVVSLFEKYDPNPYYRDKLCFLSTTTLDSSNLASECIAQPLVHQKSIFLWGDSLAAHLYPGLMHSVNLRDDNYVISQVTGTGCSFFAENTGSLMSKNCASLNQFALDSIREHKPDIVIIASRLSKNKTQDYMRIEGVIRKMKNLGIKNLFLVGLPPRWNPSIGFRLADDYKKSQRFSEYLEITSLELESQLAVDSGLKNIALNNSVFYISILDTLCNQQGCLTKVGNDIPEDLITYDYDHFTKSASEYFIKEVSYRIFKE